MISTENKLSQIAVESRFFKPGGVTDTDLKNQQA